MPRSGTSTASSPPIPMTGSFTPAGAAPVAVRQLRQGGRRFPEGRTTQLARSSPRLPDSLRARLHQGRALGRGPLVSRPPDRRRSQARLPASGPRAVYGELGREAARQAELAASWSRAPMRAWSSPGPRNLAARPLERGREPAGRLRSERSTRPATRPGLGHRLLQARKVPRATERPARWTWPGRDRTRRLSGTP